MQNSTALLPPCQPRLELNSFDNTTHIPALTIDTELIRYKWAAVPGTFPDYEKLTPTEFNLSAHFDTIEAVKAIGSLRVLADSKAYPIDLDIGNGISIPLWSDFSFVLSFI
ncbi:MAG: hypothetical protein PHI74_06235 [Methanocellales archaeon]|nr:hypothetical protein [Methanocellales archaeon]